LGNPSYIDENSAANVAARNNSTSSAADQPYYQPSNWAFQDTPPYEPYEASTSAAPAPSVYQTAGGWDLTSQHAQQQRASVVSPGGLIPQSSISPTSLYADSIAQASPVSRAASASISGSISSLPAEALNTLTPAQQEKLRSIAMPAHLQYHSPRSEPSPMSTASETKHGAHSSPEPTDKSSRKRKSSADVDEDDEDDEDHPVKKTAHNMIEKRYRTNLNDKIAALRDSVPSLRIMSKSARGEDTTEDREELHGLTPAHKLNKATVLSKATEYIRHLEKRNNRLIDENSTMQARIAAFEKLFMAGAMNGAMNSMQHPPTPVQYPHDAQPYMNTPMATPRTGESPAGMVPVPDDMKRILSAQMAAGRPYPVQQQSYQPNPALIRQQQIQQQQQMQQNRWSNTAPYFGKLMVGSLAGLMILEAVRENEVSNEKTEGRGLFALPLEFLRYVSSNLHFTFLGQHYSAAQVILALKLLVLGGTLLWVFAPWLFVPREPKPKGKSHQVSTSLEAAPSLASPIHVRRAAWLTAIQTVWVPQHNFILEAAALMLKTMKLSLRNTIGIHGYQMLTGLTEEQETARVKAWTIALDAQLAGGDVEINKSRLTLTLLASGTLPDTPIRLMLKALHIRVLLCDFCSGPQLGLVNLIAAKLARSRWNEARQLQRMLVQLRRGSADQSEDELPDHLVALLEQDCDEVLNENVIRRATNLAWNLSTMENVAETIDGMNAVVDDPAVRSPMDAVAAWWSTQTLHDALSTSLSAHKDDAEAGSLVSDKISLAVKTAPIGSDAQVRALVASAVLVDEKRGANIATALQAIGPVNTTKSAPSIISSIGSSTPDEQMALQCAIAIAHLRRLDAAGLPQDGKRLIETVALPTTMAHMSLLGCAATFKLMEELFAHRSTAQNFSGPLERLAGSLRIWVGGAAGNGCGLKQEVRHRMVDRCLSITKNVVGMENDTGYGSASEDDDEDTC
jgi:hypothetical protein